MIREPKFNYITKTWTHVFPWTNLIVLPSVMKVAIPLLNTLNPSKPLTKKSNLKSMNALSILIILSQNKGTMKICRPLIWLMHQWSLLSQRRVMRWELVWEFQYLRVIVKKKLLQLIKILSILWVMKYTRWFKNKKVIKKNSYKLFLKNKKAWV